MSEDDSQRAGEALRRREFLKRAGAAGAAASVLGTLPTSIQKALAIPAARVTGTIRDVEHVVILMQENRSFDHYFGTMSGVRGFGDKSPISLRGNKPVWFQSDGTKDIVPFHLDTQRTSAMRVPGTPHTWPDAQLAWDQGRFGAWPKYKQFQSMGYYEEDDIPFQRALAEAFTLCDAHHCSIQTGTLPNRVVFMTGTNVAPGRTEPAEDQTLALIDNANNRGLKFGSYGWTTYPERLQASGIRWRIYQNPEDNWGGLLAPWESFRQYKGAQPGEPLFENAMRAWSLADLQRDVREGNLPQVSWIIPSPVWSEHPTASSPLQGASFTQQVLEILVSNPEVWSKTVFLVSFDENDGFFDHVPPPAVPSLREDGSSAGKTTLSTPLGGEYYRNEVGGVVATRPYGMGPRVPLYVISPWSRGGWVCSQVFDHTSTIRFLEARFGVLEPNITPWHRAVSGDLTRCFDFAHPNDAALPELPDMSAAKGEPLVIDGLPPVALPDARSLPRQDPGVRYSRALPYVLHAQSDLDPLRKQLELSFENAGSQAAVFHVYDRLHLDQLPRRYTVEASKILRDLWSTRADQGAYDLCVLGPNGFVREFMGPRVTVASLRFSLPEVRIRYDVLARALDLIAWNSGTLACRLHAAGAYPGDEPFELTLRPLARPERRRCPLRASGLWYDLTLTVDDYPGWSRRLAGRMETGRDGVTDPAFGW